jgi:hypothetical protein
VPSLNVEGLIDHPFGKREISPGSRANTINADPLGALAQHYDAVYSDIHKNNIVRKLIGDTVDRQRRDPSFGKLFTELPNNIQNERMISVRTADGLKHYRVNNATLYQALKTNPTQLGVVGNFFAHSRRLVQSASTGPLSLLGGSWFSAKSALRNSMLLPIVQQKNMASGLVDALAQKHLGVSTRWLPDPTRIAGIANAGVRDMGAMFAGRLADALHPNSGEATATTLRKIFGNRFVDAAHTRAKAAYHSSVYAEMRGQGVSSTGAHGSMEAPTYQLAPQDRTTVRTSMSSLDPNLFHNKLKGSYLNFQGLVHDVNNVIGDAPISHYYRLNKQFNLGGRSSQELAHAVRTVVGDPGIGGASKVTRGITAAVPYSNVSMQGIDAIGRALHQAPVGTTAAMTSAVLIPALASLYTAMRAGPEAVKHLQEEVSTRQRESNVYLYHGDDQDHPEKATSISLPQEMRMPYALMLEMTANGLGAFQHREGEPMHERIFHSLQDVFSHRVSHTTLTALTHAAQDTVGFSLPGPVNAAANVIGGVQLEPNLDTLVNNIVDGKPPFSGMSRAIGKKGSSPGQDLSSTFTDNDSSVFKSVLGNIGGVAAKSWDFVDAGRRDYKERGDLGHAIGTVAEQWSQGFHDQTTFANRIWGNAAKLSTAGPLEENVNRTLAVLRPLAGAATAMSAQGLTRPKGVQIDTGDTSRVPEGVDGDIRMRRMYLVAARVGQQIESKFVPRITDMRKYIEDAGKKGDYYADDQREVVNNHTRALHREYEQVNQRLRMLNVGLSQIAGRPVDVRNIDWSKGMDQFD